MKKEDFFALLSGLDDDLLSDADRYAAKRNRTRAGLRVALIAACVCLIAVAILMLPMLRRDIPPTTEPNQTQPTDQTPTATNDPFGGGKPLPPASVLHDALSNPIAIGSAQHFVTGSGPSAGGADAVPLAFRFASTGLVAKVRVTEALPDTYEGLEVHSDYKPMPYRLVRMEVLQAVHGEGIPETIYYMIPAYWYRDLSEYDSLLISLTQVGAVGFTIKNVTAGCVERLDAPLFRDYNDRPMLGGVIAFSDGVLDKELWSDTWDTGHVDLLDNPAYIWYVAGTGDSIETVIDNIQAEIEEQKNVSPNYYRMPRVISLDFVTEEAREVLAYVTNFENGVFAQALYYGTGIEIVTFRRYINGCQTEEWITVDLDADEHVEYSPVRYTPEDMACLPDIGAQIAELAEEFRFNDRRPTTHIANPYEWELYCLSIYGWYGKAEDGTVYGVVKVVWRYYDEEERLDYYDDVYCLLDTDFVWYTHREEIISLIGDRNVYRGEYGIGMELPQC